MSLVIRVALGVTSQNIDDVSFSVFQLASNPNAPTLICGNIFLGLQGYIAVRIPIGLTQSLQRGGTIDPVSSFPNVSFIAAGSWTAGGQILCNVMADDSPRFSADDGLGDAGLFDSRLAWKPESGYGPAWRRDFSGIFDTRLEDTGGTPFVDLGSGTAGNFGVRAVAGHREQMAQIITVPAGPSWSVARATMELRRFGNPIGTMEVALQGSQSDGFGHIEPDGVDLGVSATVLNSIITPSPGSGPIPFAFTPDVVLAPGTYWAVLRPSVPYPVSGVDFVAWMQKRVFLGPGGSHRTLLGEAFDSGNYPGHVDVHFDTIAKEVGTSIVWNPPAAVAGDVVVSPDLTPLVQEMMLSRGHESIHALCFTFRTVGQTRTYRLASYAHPTYQAPGFGAQYRRRDIRGDVS